MGIRRSVKKLDSGQLWNYALKALGQRAHSTVELKQKLARRAERPADVADVMTKLREYGLSDDEKFSEAFAASRLQNDGLGKLRVVRDLRARRISDRVASRTVEKVYGGVNEVELIQAFLQRKYRSVNLKEFVKEEKHLASVYRRLRNAGFSSGATFQVLKQLSARVDDWEEPEESTEDG